MTEAPEHHLLRVEIERTIRAVAGVTTLFRTGSTVAKVVAAGSELVSGARESAPLVRLDETPEGVRIEASLGVRTDTSGVETLQRVYEAVEALLAAQGVAVAEIALTVVHVNGSN